MKNIIAVTLLILLTVLNSCVEESFIPRKGKIQFSMPGNEGGKTKGGQEPAKVMVSISNSAGNTIVLNKILILIGFGSGYISEDLELEVGNYQLTQFIILDSNNKAIYATPLEGFEFADLVSDPLPIAFSVTENGNTLVTPQVAPIDDSVTPEKFGYVSFGFEIVTTASKLKSILSYWFDKECDCYLPSSKVVIDYDDQGRLAGTQVYGNFEIGNGFRLNWTTSCSNDGNSLIESRYDPTNLHSTREVFFDVNGVVSSVRLSQTDYQGQLKFIGEHAYEYTATGFIMYVLIPGNISAPRVEFELISGNVVNQKTISAYGTLVEEAVFTYDNHPNPVHSFFPLFTNSASKNNLLTMSIGNYSENFAYVYYPGGQVKEVIRSRVDGPVEKIMYEYY